MKIKEYNKIDRRFYPKWRGWKILDFYSEVNLRKDEKTQDILNILSENFHLVQRIIKLK